jgi:hypothetical protein
MTALRSVLTLIEAASGAVAFVRIHSTDGARPEPGTIVRSIGAQVHASFLAQRSLAGQLDNGACRAEDDYRRFAHRAP